MDLSLILAAALMGLAGTAHCALMCGPLCAGRVRPALLLGRSLGYAGIGGALAGSAGWASDFVLRGGAGPLSPWLTLWAMAHAAAFSLGVWLLWNGRQPLWVATLGHRVAGSDRSIVRILRRSPGSLGQVTLGLAWVLLPCGLLQSALVLAALSSDAVTGSLVMGVFSLACAPGLVAAPVLRSRLALPRGLDWPVRLNRISGLLLMLASGWALGFGLWQHVRDYC